MDGTTDRLQVLNGHPQNGQFVQFVGHGDAHGHDAGQFRDVRVHLVPAPLLDLAVVLPNEQDNG